MGEVVRTTREPMLGPIRLAWWRERLEELDAGAAPAEPRLQQVERELSRAASRATTRRARAGWLGCSIRSRGQRDGRSDWAARQPSVRPWRAAARGSRRAERAPAGCGRWSMSPGTAAMPARAACSSIRLAARELAASLADGAPAAVMLAVLASRDCARRAADRARGDARPAGAMLRHRLGGTLSTIVVDSGRSVSE